MAVLRSTRRSPIGRALEPRMMFDGAAPVTVAAATAATDVSHTDAMATQTASSSTTSSSATTTTGIVREVTGAHQVVFIDGSIDQASKLAAAAPADADVMVLDPTRDGIQQISDFLHDHTGLDAVQIVSHGNTGEITLGTTVLSEANLADHAAELKDWGSHLAAGADILIYGCDVAQGSAGQHFINDVASLTGTDVAASTDITGTADHGANWTLEYKVGNVQTASMDFSTAGWDGDLTSSTGTVYFLSGYQLEQELGSASNKYWTTGSFDSSVASADLLGVTGHTSGYFNISSISFTPSATAFIGGVYQGNDHTGILTFKGSYLDNTHQSATGSNPTPITETASEVTISLAGTISRVDQPGGKVASMYFWTMNFAGASVTDTSAQLGLGFALIVPGQTSATYSSSGSYTTSANNTAVTSALNDVLTSQSSYSSAITAVADTASLFAGGTVTGTSGSSGTGVLGNDTDSLSGHTLTVYNFGAGTAAPTTQAGATVTGTYGDLTLNANGSYSYTANNAAGIPAGEQRTDTFTYQEGDGQGGFATTTLTITVGGPGPLASADTGTVTQGSTLTAGGTGVLSNDTDSNTSLTLTVAGVTTGTTATAQSTGAGSQIDGTYGHLTLNADGTYTYAATVVPTTGVSTTTPTLDDVFTYTVSDGTHTANTTLTIHVTPLLPSAPTVSWTATVTGVEGSDISLNSLSPSLGGNTLNSLVITGAPTNAVLSDGNGHTHTSTGTTDAIDIRAWDLGTLKVTPANDLNFTLTATATDKNTYNNISASGTGTETVTVNPLAPTPGWASGATASGIEGTAIPLTTLSTTINSMTGDSNLRYSLTIHGVPTGATLSDGTHSATSTSTTQEIDVSSWTLSNLKVTSTDAGNFTLTATAKEKDSENNLSTTGTADEVVTIYPKTPTLSWSPTASGTKQTDVALGQLTATINKLGSETNTWDTLTISGVPTGVVLADGAGGHSVTSTGAAIDITGWTLTALTVNSSTAQAFTLTVTAKEQDAESNKSSTATTTEAVTISDAAVTPPTAAWNGPVTATEGAARTLPLTYGITTNGDSLNGLIISGAPAGTVLKDGNGHTFTSTGPADTIDVKAWDLSTLQVVPTNAANFTLTVTATEKDGSGNVSSTVTDNVNVTVNPSAPTVAWQPTTTGQVNTNIDLGTLTAAVTNRTGDTNQINTLTISGGPAGVILSDGSGHTHTFTGPNEAVDVSGWSLTTLKATSGTAQVFTLTATATERDTETNTSTNATTNETVTVTKPAEPPPIDPIKVPPVIVPKPDPIPQLPAPPPNVQLPADPIVRPFEPVNLTFGDARSIDMTFTTDGPQVITDGNLQVQVASQSSSSISNVQNRAVEKQTFVINAKELGQGSNPLVRVDAGLPKWMKIEGQENGALKATGDRPLGDTQVYRVQVKIKRASGEEANVIIEVAPTKTDTSGQATKPVPAPHTGMAPEVTPERHASADSWLDQLLAAFDRAPAEDHATAGTVPAGFLGQVAAEANATITRTAELAA
jgi:VCBS repeat-containing protein